MEKKLPKEIREGNFYVRNFGPGAVFFRIIMVLLLQLEYLLVLRIAAKYYMALDV